VRGALVTLFVLIGALLPSASWAEEYAFDASEFEKKPYHLGGYLEARPALMGLDRDSALYKLRFRGRDEEETAYEYSAGALLDAGVEKGSPLSSWRWTETYPGGCSTPEVSYTGITNLELRLKAAYLAGERLSGYGEKQNDYRVEFRARYYF
jgi:hypothetical protein